jgi:hypothetical protein
VRHGGAVLAILTLGSGFPLAVHAQPAPGRVEVSVGWARTGAISFASPDALEEDRAGNPYILFTADSELRRAAGYGARIALRLGGRLHAETGISYSKPELVVRVGSDVEDAEAISITETISQLHVEAAILAELTPARPGRRTVPFVTAGAGYLRELHEGQTLVVDGRSYFLGAGVKRFLTIRPGWLKAVGVRADGRIAIRSKGVAFDERVSLAPAFGGSLFVRF